MIIERGGRQCRGLPRPVHRFDHGGMGGSDIANGRSGGRPINFPIRRQFHCFFQAVCRDVELITEVEFEACGLGQLGDGAAQPFDRVDRFLYSLPQLLVVISARE